MKTLIVATRKGGVGKTTLAIHLAWYFAEQQKRVLVLDLDGQANASQTLSAYAIPGVTASLLFEATKLPPIAAVRPPEDGSSIALIASDKKLDDFGTVDAQRIVPIFVNHLRTLDSGFDICIVDTPPSAGICGVAAMIAGDAVVSPIDLENYAMQGIRDTIQAVTGVTKRFNKKLRFIGILPSRVDGRSASQQDALKQLMRDFGHMVIPSTVKESEAIASVPRAKVPVWKLGTSSGREHGRAMQATFKLIEQKVFA